MNRFVRFELRTSAPDAARAFYDTILEEPCVDVSPQPETARARGAPPQWLGHVGVADVAATLAAFVARGATLLGPAPSGPAARAVVRDPGGVIVALTPLASPSRGDVIWHQLVTPDLPTAQANYAALFGWSIEDSMDVAGFGALHRFGFSPGAPVGAMAAIEGRAGVHPQWLFFFRATRLDEAMERTRAAGGLVLEPVRLPSGARCVACDDPQGGAFGLMEPPPT